MVSFGMFLCVCVLVLCLFKLSVFLGGFLGVGEFVDLAIGVKGTHLRVPIW